MNDLRGTDENFWVEQISNGMCSKKTLVMIVLFLAIAKQRVNIEFVLSSITPPCWGAVHGLDTGLQQQQTLTSVSCTCTRAMSTRLSYTILYTRSTNRLKGRVKASDMKLYRDKRGTKQNRCERKSYSIKADMTDSQSGDRYESPMRLIYWFVGSRLALVTTISIC